MNVRPCANRWSSIICPVMLAIYPFGIQSQSESLTRRLGEIIRHYNAVELMREHSYTYREFSKIERRTSRGKVFNRGSYETDVIQVDGAPYARKMTENGKDVPEGERKVINDELKEYVDTTNVSEALKNPWSRLIPDLSTSAYEAVSEDTDKLAGKLVTVITVRPKGISGTVISGAIWKLWIDGNTLDLLRYKKVVIVPYNNIEPGSTWSYSFTLHDGIPLLDRMEITCYYGAADKVGRSMHQISTFDKYQKLSVEVTIKPIEP